MSQYLLSICIPTYNRATYLAKCLESIFSQINNENKLLVEVVVIDNNSSDNTRAIAEGYSKYDLFKYTKNTTNIGGAKNVFACFENAMGKYVWVLSDDDFILPFTLSHIIGLLRNKEIGIVALQSIWYDEESDIKSENIPINKYVEYTNGTDFFNEINIWITFISGIIVNKENLDRKSGHDRFVADNLPQLSWVIPAIFQNKLNIKYISNTIGCKKNNTGGYNLVEVFSINLKKILTQYVSEKTLPKECLETIDKNLIKNFYPNFINPSLSVAYYTQINELYAIYKTNSTFYWYCFLFPIIKVVKKSILP